MNGWMRKYPVPFLCSFAVFNQKRCSPLHEILYFLTVNVNIKSLFNTYARLTKRPHQHTHLIIAVTVKLTPKAK